ncbi:MULTISPECIES: hypothetical protein, partial [Bacteroides]|uniref:hypothetical protein n=1 Tax=Bacteroides TaxID=816 RepID=UPI001122DB94
MHLYAHADAYSSGHKRRYMHHALIRLQFPIRYACPCKVYPTVKLEVQLRHRLPPSLERSGKGGGRRWKPGFGSSG